MAHGVEGQDIYLDDVDRARFMDDLRRIVRESGATILAYCLMGNHFHLGIQVGTIKLSSIMHRLMTAHAKAFNQRHDRKGHLFRARHEEVLCGDEKYLAALIRYIHRNPVKAGLVTRPEDWPWSSAAGKPVRDEEYGDLDQFDPWTGAQEAPPSLIRHSSIELPDIGVLGQEISARTGIPSSEFRSDSRRRPVVAARRLLAQEAFKSGHPLIVIARWLNSSPASLTRYARSNTENTGKTGTS